MQFRFGTHEGDVRAAAQIDARATGTDARASYLRAMSQRGGLRLALDQTQIVGFCCVDDQYFFEKAFITLLVVDHGSRRRGIGQALLEATASETSETWTSTNRSNAEMRGLLAKSGWTFCGEIEGLDDGDPEMFFKKRHLSLEA